MEERKTTILAVAGKGGVGKTSVAATMVRLLCQMHPGKRILAIDADPAVGLATALGVEVCLTVDDIRKAVVAQARQGDDKAAVELLGEARCQIFDAVAESRGFAFLAIGRPESAGCYCKVMYDQVGAIVNRLPSREVIPLLDTGDIPVLSYIENDAALADFDIRGENVFYLPESANIVRGVREALEKLSV